MGSDAAAARAASTTSVVGWWSIQPIITREFDMSAPAALRMDAGIAVEAALGLTVPASLSIGGAARLAADMQLTVPPRLGIMPGRGFPGELIIPATIGIGAAATHTYDRGFALAVPAGIVAVGAPAAAAQPFALSGAITLSMTGQLVTPPLYNDNFNRADTTDISGQPIGTPGNLWTLRLRRCGIWSNRAYSAGTGWGTVSWNQSMATDDHKVSAVGNWSGGIAIILILASGTAQQCGVLIEAGAVSIVTSTDWFNTVRTSRATISGQPMTDNDRWSIERNGAVFTVRRNGGAAIVTWNDPGNYMPRNASNRLVGFAGFNTLGVTGFPPTNANWIDDWEADDIAPTLLTGGYYLQSTVHPANNPATFAYMNNGSADGAANDAQTGTDGLGPETGMIVRDLGAVCSIHSLVIGYDYLRTLYPGIWGPEFTDGCWVVASAHPGADWPQDWNWITPLPAYADSGSNNGLVTIPLTGNWRWILIQSANPAGYMCLLEFQVIGWA